MLCNEKILITLYLKMRQNIITTLEARAAELCATLPTKNFVYGASSRYSFSDLCVFLK